MSSALCVMRSTPSIRAWNTGTPLRNRAGLAPCGVVDQLVAIFRRGTFEDQGGQILGTRIIAARGRAHAAQRAMHGVPRLGIDLLLLRQGDFIRMHAPLAHTIEGVRLDQLGQFGEGMQSSVSYRRTRSSSVAWRQASRTSADLTRSVCTRIVPI